MVPVRASRGYRHDYTGKRHYVGNWRHYNSLQPVGSKQMLGTIAVNLHCGTTGTYTAVSSNVDAPSVRT